MKNRLLLPALALLLSLPAAPALQAQAPAPEQRKKVEETELGKTMDKLNGAWRKLRKQAGDPASNAASLELVAVIQAAGEKALTLTPARVEDVPPVDRGKFTEDYRKEMKEFLARVGQLETALRAGDNGAAAQLIQKIGDLQKEAHREFKRPDR